MRADNQGEGGILALTALIPAVTALLEGTQGVAVGRPILIALGIFGAALLYGEEDDHAGDQSSALSRACQSPPVFTQWVVPISVAILIGLFVIQQHGTDRVGKLFGPVMTIWFVTIAFVGVAWIIRARRCSRPSTRVTASRSSTRRHGFPCSAPVPRRHEAAKAPPTHGALRQASDSYRLVQHGAAGVVAELLRPGALLIVNAQATQPFFMMVPSWALLPYVALSTSAAVIASQALISGAFSVTGRRFNQLHAAPRCRAHVGA